MKTRTTTCRPLHAVPSLHRTPLARRPRLQRSSLEFGILKFGIFLGFGILGFGISGALPAQLAPITTGTLPHSDVTPITTGTGAGTATDEDVVQMSVFNVNPSKDEGYMAMNTASGSRINTPLKDTAASIQPFTQEFLNDVGATTIDDMLQYGSNVEFGDISDITGGNNPESNMGGTSTDTNFRIRGMAMTTAMDGVETTFSQDAYNIERAEISSGPNSILFGMGQAGGMVTLTSMSANLQRNTTHLSTTIGTWGNLGQPWNYYRASLNYNLVLMPRILGLRIMGMFQDGNNGSWRYWNNSHDKRINPAITFKPWKNTRIKVSYETGVSKNALSTTWNAADHITGWLNAGRPIHYSFNGSAISGATQKIRNNSNVSNGTNPYYIFVDNDQTVYDGRMSFKSVNQYAGNPDQVRLPAELSSFYYTTVGPGGWREQRFDRYQLVLEQSIGNLNFQIGYYHNKNSAVSHGIPNYDVALLGDPNYYVSTPEWFGSNGASTVVNPWCGHLYMEDNWEKRTVLNRNDTIRLTAEYSLNLQKYGRHRLIANVDRAYVDQKNRRWGEILVDETQHPIFTANPGWAKNSPNYVIRRHYVTEGDFSTYYDADWSVPLNPFTLNGHTYHSQYATRSISHNKRTTDSASLTLQSYWFRDSLVTMFGGRLNDTFQQSEGTPRITDPNDPRLLNGSFVFSDNDFNGVWSKGKHRRPFTYSAGTVWHATDRFSLFANYSSNRDDSSLNHAIITGYPDPSIGYTRDIGVMFDILGNNKFFLRLTSFNTDQRNSLTDYNNNKIIDVSDRLQDIFTALNDTMVITQAEYAARPPAFNSGLSDVNSSGYEAEVNAQLAKGFTMRFTLSYTTRMRQNTFSEMFTYFNANIPHWMNLADPTKNGGSNVSYIDPNGAPTTLYDYLLSQLYALGTGDTNTTGASIRDNLAMEILGQSGGLASRPLKFNITAKYTFQKNAPRFLQGFAVGGAVRYAGPNKIPDPNRIASFFTEVTEEDHPTDMRLDPNALTDLSQMINGNSLTFWDMFITYRRKVSLLGINTNMSLQLNIKNLFNTGPVTASRWNADSNGLIYLRRMYLNDPRSIRLTANFDF